MAMKRAVIFDKDGTLVEDVPYNADPARICLAPGAAAALRHLRDAGYALLIASNQSGIARGYFDEDALVAMERRVRQLLAAQGAWLDGCFYCPHHPEAAIAAYRVRCACRKPAPALLLHAAASVGAAPEYCWMVGDILDDIEAGRRAGMRAMLIDNGNETVWHPGPMRTPDVIVHSLEEAAISIVATDSRAEHELQARLGVTP